MSASFVRGDGHVTHGYYHGLDVVRGAGLLPFRPDDRGAGLRGLPVEAPMEDRGPVFPHPAQFVEAGVGLVPLVEAAFVLDVVGEFVDNVAGGHQRGVVGSDPFPESPYLPARPPVEGQISVVADEDLLLLVEVP